MGVMEKVLNQCRQPTGVFGRCIARGMNVGHSRLWDWGLGHVFVPPEASILDIGCGGGKVIRKLAGDIPGSRVWGIDYSEDMVRMSRSVNRTFIRAGRVEVNRGCVSDLPFPEDMFDLVTAFETCYFWPAMIDDLMEVRRVLKPGGTLLMTNEAYEHARFANRNSRLVKWGNINLYAPKEYRKFLSASGYSDIRVFELPSKNWISAVARKDEPPEAES